MTTDEFTLTLQAAIAGSHEALEKILELYAPLIRKHSCCDGNFNEDLQQHVSNLRKKLREAGGGEYIEAVWGIGFKLTEKS